MTRLLIAAGLLTALTGLAVSPAAPLEPQKNDPNWVTIKGRITWKGTPPPREKINVTVDKTHCLSKGPLLNEEILVNPKTKGLANVFIWLAPVEEDGTLPIH